MIGVDYEVRALRAILGSSRSGLFPPILWSGWLDGSGDLIAMTGMSHANTDATFGELTGEVVNVTDLDCGVAGTGWVIAGVGFYDAAASGSLVVSADLTSPYSPADGDPLVIPLGDLHFAAV
jgi:hypothetical protein